ncbi:MAG: hypothetical protein DCC71_12275 [Proteobacteria bacterium]|nr:MAG: hypothetical protein DCC71_12275 [Pseudomonadota bacterium]
MKYVGKSIPMMTNRKLAAGAGTFTADVMPPGIAYIAVLRSPYAHARIVSVDTSAAEKLDGVVAVVTGQDVAHLGPIPATVDPPAYGGRARTNWALPVDRASFVGEPVAVVVAESRYVAEQALPLVEIEWEEIPAVLDPIAALEPGSPRVEPDWPDNLLLERTFTSGDVDRGLAAADGVLSGRVKAQRYVPSPIEPRAFVATWEPVDGFLTFWASTQMPHSLRALLAKQLGMAETQIRVIQPHVGGGFGLKGPLSPEEVLVAHLAIKLNRAIGWIESRSEHLLAAGHCRETILEFEAGYKNDGAISGLRVRVVADVGAPRATYGWAQSFVTAYSTPTGYKVPDCRVDLRTVVTNKCPWQGYRAFGKEAASYLMERVLDRIADATGLDRAAVRMRNFVQPDEFPYSQVSGAILDSGDYGAALRRVLEMVDVPKFREEQKRARAEGRRLGMGISFALTPEGCALPNSALLQGYDGTGIRITPSGHVTVLTGVTSPGSGNETGIAQIVADTIGVRMEDIRVVQGDTDKCPYGLGNYSSRSLMMGGSAALLAAKDLREKLLNVAAVALEVLPEELDSEDGTIFVKGAPVRKISLSEVAHMIYQNAHGKEAIGVEPGLEAVRYYKVDNVYHQPETQGRFSSYPTWPYEACAAIVEVDEETGVVKVVRYVAVHDCGVVVNPLLVDANLHGGIAQGIGAALYEDMVYDENGQLLTTTLMDYTMPTALEIPLMELDHQETPTPFTPLGTKGAGESGITGPLSAIASAIEDAFPEKKLALMETPMTPSKIWRALHQTA